MSDPAAAAPSSAPTEEDDPYAVLAEEVWRQRVELNAQRVLMVFTWSALLEHEPEPMAWLDVMDAELREAFGSPDALSVPGAPAEGAAVLREAMGRHAAQFIADLRDTARMHQARRDADAEAPAGSSANA